MARNVRYVSLEWSQSSPTMHFAHWVTRRHWSELCTSLWPRRTSWKTGRHLHVTDSCCCTHKFPYQPPALQQQYYRKHHNSASSEHASLVATLSNSLKSSRSIAKHSFNLINSLTHFLLHSFILALLIRSVSVCWAWECRCFAGQSGRRSVPRVQRLLPGATASPAFHA